MLQMETTFSSPDFCSLTSVLIDLDPKFYRPESAASHLSRKRTVLRLKSLHFNTGWGGFLPSATTSSTYPPPLFLTDHDFSIIMHTVCYRLRVVTSNLALHFD